MTAAVVVVELATSVVAWRTKTDEMGREDDVEGRSDVDEHFHQFLRSPGEYYRSDDCSKL